MRNTPRLSFAAPRTNAAGIGIVATGGAPLNVTARHYTKTDMERAGYTFQMKRHPETYLNIDGAQMGAGGIDSWSPNAYPMLPYRIASGEAMVGVMVTVPVS